MVDKTAHRIDIVPAKFAADNRGLHDYVVPAGMNSIVWLSNNVRHSSPRIISPDHVAIFSRWNQKEQDYVIWKVL